MLSQNMGYNVFGFKAGNYMQGAGEGFDEYERLRNLGYSKEEALAKALGKGGYAIASTKVDDYLGKNNIVDERLFGKNGIVDKSNSVPKFFEVKSPTDSKDVLEYLEYIKKDSTIKYGNEDVRKWYVNTVGQIHKMIDESLPMLEKAHQAFDLRNEIRTGARNIMADSKLRERLDIDHKNYTFEELIISKIQRKGLTEEEAIQDIYETAITTNKEVNSIWGIEK